MKTLTPKITLPQDDARAKRDAARAGARRADRISGQLYLTTEEAARWQQVKLNNPLAVEQFKERIYAARGMSKTDARFLMIQVRVTFDDLAVRDPKTEEKWWKIW
jgi:hypothetical protein